MLSKKLFLSGILVFVLLSFGFVVSVEASSTGWSQTYGGTDREEVFSLVVTSDGGYALAGRTASFGAGGSDFWLVKTDENGNMEWTRTYGGTNADRASSLVESSDGDYVLAGVTSSFGAGGYDFWLIKIDAAGNVEWNQTYGGTKNDHAQSLVESSDGDYVLAGVTSSFGAGGYDFWLIKIDAAGNVEWNHTYGGVDEDYAFHLVETFDGGYAIAGRTRSFGAGEYDLWLVKTDEFGHMEWNRTYGGVYDDYSSSLVVTSDGGYALAGRTASFGAGGSDFWLVKTDENGNMEWNHTYGGTKNDYAYALVESSDGGFVLAGVKDYATDRLSFSPISGAFWLVKTDESGNMEWTRTYGGTNADRASSLVATFDRGYAIAGEKSGDFWLIKTDKYGIIPEWYPPYICVSSPQKTTYTTDNVSLNFTVNEETSWMGYSLNGQDNVTITETTLNLTELVNCSHYITVYATDTDGNTAASETIRFTVAKEKETEPPPPPATWTTTAIATAAVAATGAALLIIYTKTKKKQNKK